MSRWRQTERLPAVLAVQSGPLFFSFFLFFSSEAKLSAYQDPRSRPRVPEAPSRRESLSLRKSPTSITSTCLVAVPSDSRMRVPVRVSIVFNLSWDAFRTTKPAKAGRRRAVVATTPDTRLLSDTREDINHLAVPRYSFAETIRRVRDDGR